MRKNKKNEELQSRREFFKKAAKGALPILGAVILAGTPAFVKAAEESPMGCRYGCSTSCSGGCYTNCYGSCKNACDGCKYTCSGTCKNACLGCRYTCEGTCKNTCEGTCNRSSR